MSTPRHSWKTFLHYVIPSVSAMVLFSAYTIVDGIFVSKGVGELALAGVNIALPFINVLSGTAILLSMGTSTLCAFALGHGDHEKAEKIFTQTVVAIVAISAVITVAVSLFSEPLAVLLGAGPQTVGYSAQYLHMVCLFSVCFILAYCLEVMVKVDGAPQLAMFGVGISFLINVGLDYLFIMVFHWGVWGAALATGLAQLGSLIFFLIYFLSGKSNLRFRRFRFRLKDFRRILPLGIADCSIELMLGFLTLLYNHVITQLLGESSLPIFAVIAYLSLVVSMVMQGIAQGMMPLVSLAVGENDRPSIRVYLRKALLSVLVIGVLVELFCQAAPGTIVSLLLSGDSALFDETVSALRQYALSYLPAGLTIVLAGYFAALGKAGASALPRIPPAAGRPHGPLPPGRQRHDLDRRPHWRIAEPGPGPLPSAAERSCSQKGTGHLKTASHKNAAKCAKEPACTITPVPSHWRVSFRFPTAHEWSQVSVPVMFFLPVQRRDPLHLPLCQRKVKKGEILPEMIWITGARNHHHTLLQIPPENHLRHRFPMGCGNFLAHRIIQQSPGEAPSPQRIPSLHNNPPFLNVLHHRAILIEGMDFILNQCRLHGYLWQESIHLADIITGNPSRSYLSLPDRLLNGLVCRHIIGCGMVQEHHVNISNIQLAQCLIYRLFRVAVLVRIQLCLHKDL